MSIEDKDIVMAAISRDHRLIEFAGDKIKTDKEIVGILKREVGLNKRFESSHSTSEPTKDFLKAMASIKDKKSAIGVLTRYPLAFKYLNDDLKKERVPS